jgi:D-alanine--poly(phosphoribitol) ligase subunit 2
VVYNEKVMTAIFNAIDEVNQIAEPEQILKKAQETVLFGEGSQLDSLGLVSLIVATEQQVQEAFGKSIVLADERAMSQKRSPFRTVSSLSEYIGTLLDI